MIAKALNLYKSLGILRPADMPLIARYTFRRHIAAAVIDGFLLGGFINALADMVLKRALSATDFQIALFTMLAPIAMVFSMHWASYIKGRDKGPFFLIAGVFGRLVLLLMLFCHTASYYIAIMGVYWLFNTLLIPTMNNIVQNNYPAHLRGQIFGTVAAVGMAASLPMAVLSGKLLEYDENVFRWAFALAGVIGFFSVLILKSIRIRHRPVAEGEVCPLPERPAYFEHYRYAHVLAFLDRAAVAPVKETIKLFADNPLYAKFEAAFMIYGFGFMVILPALPKWFDEVLKMRYDDISLARTVAAGVCMILFSQLMGKLMDRTNPIKFCAYTFAVLVLYPLFIVLIPSQFGVYAGFVAFGIGMVGVNLAWNLSSIYFAGDSEVSQFMGAHATLVGFRGTLGPLIGFIVMRYFPISVVFYLSAAFFALASIQMTRLHRENRRKERAAAAAQAAA
ncbi:MAG: MFS transporter [bacterium]|jgi:hypothetical protein